MNKQVFIEIIEYRCFEEFKEKLEKLIDVNVINVDILKQKDRIGTNIAGNRICYTDAIIKITKDSDLKPFQDEYFRGLTNEEIAELAKKSIKVTSYNRKLEHQFEDIKELLHEAQSKSEELMIGDFKQYFDEEFIEKIYAIINESEE